MVTILILHITALFDIGGIESGVSLAAWAQLKPDPSSKRSQKKAANRAKRMTKRAPWYAERNQGYEQPENRKLLSLLLLGDR